MSFHGIPTQAEARRLIQPGFQSLEALPNPHVKKWCLCKEAIVGVSIIRVQSMGDFAKPKFFGKVFATLNAWGLSIDLAVTSSKHVSVALHHNGFTLSESMIGPEENGGDTIMEEKIRGAVKELRMYGQATWESNMALIRIAENQPKPRNNLFGEIASTMADQGISVVMISQGTGSSNMSCVIRREDIDVGLAVLQDHMSSPRACAQRQFSRADVPLIPLR